MNILSIIRPMPTKKIADCENGPGQRLVVAIGAQGYVKTFYTTMREPKAPADPRESRAPKARNIKPQRKGKR